MSHVRGAVAVAVVALALSASALAQKPLAIPAAGQSMEQQRRDDFICLEDVKRKTGFDPALALPASPVSPTTRSDLAPGVQRTIPDDPARGRVVVDEDLQRAEVGGGTGMYAPRGARQTAQAEQRESRLSAQAERERQDDFYRQYGACMRDRGYNVR